ncbi:type VI secretion system lipoprotein TssJ [Paenalcaligenes faecalis]|uniref:type VI secretion system lipoprotein TssJ n=1 Tax=Paenalcaligenes faecalis TaxID=2980099 RepID=UPI0022B9666B|nr:type VI secretion system lipoprotein TssJ [Paenalcaligenes faecalis]
MSKNRRQFMTLSVSAIALWLSGCAATENKLAIPYAVQLAGSAEQNPTAQGQAAPVQIMVYQLRAKDRFEAADYFSLQQQASTVLGDQLLAQDAVVIAPEETQLLASSGHVDARYLGIVAGYRDLNQSQWRLTVPLPAAKSTNIYKFWQFSPRQALVRIGVEKNQLHILPSL